ncbi:hypothetical protein P40081_14525 [Paenibacillus sp. FSL P4-0081]|uniref:hypothetical protein n=1 Tax=unclassified Paenibacillus TaxID=185978 RepID=UPI0004F602B1|nr:hypothetical protein [Paenibacillus sp. FSL P4-0081]AIQ29236.1 hypothetical protein P40081_14525 [Paenibacillus sp. FSL P4-0081]
MRFKLLIIVPIVILLISCSAETNVHSYKKGDNRETVPALSYKVESDSYAQNNINITYPKLVDLPNDTKEEVINDLIRVEALGVLESYSLDLDSHNTLEIDYQITYKSDKFLSIQYIGSALNKGGAYPLNVFYTTNIDVDKEIKVKLTDLLEIDEAFVQELKNGIYRSYDDNLNLREEGVMRDYWSGIKDQELLNDLKYTDEADGANNSVIFSYLTQDSLGISLSVPHALGDHLEMEIGYEKLSENIKGDNSPWD